MSIKPKKGGLSHTEKGRILYLLQTLGDKPESYKEIAKDLGRPVASIKKTISEMKSIFNPNSEFKIKKSIIETVVHGLMGSGLSEAAANNKIIRVLNKLTTDEQSKITAASLQQSCLKLTSDIDYYVRTSEKGNKGFAASTQAASERADSIDKNKILPPKNPAVYKLYPDD